MEYPLKKAEDFINVQEKLQLAQYTVLNYDDIYWRRMRDVAIYLCHSISGWKIWL